MTNCCSKCNSGKVLEICMDYNCPCGHPKQSTCKKCLQLQAAKICQICPDCHNTPKQSTELEEILREFDRMVADTTLVHYEGETSFVKAYISQAYQSGHTAGQAAEREKTLASVVDYIENHATATKVNDDGTTLIFAKFLKEDLSSLNKD